LTTEIREDARGKSAGINKKKAFSEKSQKAFNIW
jgi:hypothetical protein